MQHVGIGQHDVGAFANSAAGVLRCIAIVGERAQVFVSGLCRMASTAPGTPAIDLRPALSSGKDIARARRIGNQAI